MKTYKLTFKYYNFSHNLLKIYTIGGEKMALNYMRIGRRVQEIRKMRKLSQADLAELADISVPYISHIETALKKPSLESVVKIADALGVTVDQLLNGNQSNDHHTYEAEVAELLADCNSKERRMIFELVTLVKRCLRENSWFFQDSTLV